MPKVEFHFDFGSPNAYLSHLVIPAIEGRTGATFEYVPVLLGGVFKLTNNVSPAISLKDVKNKPEYQQLEMRRFLAAHGITALKTESLLPGEHTADYAGGPFLLSGPVFFKSTSTRFISTCGRSPRKWMTLT